MAGPSGVQEDEKKKLVGEIGKELFERAKNIEIEGEIPKTPEQILICELVDGYTGEIAEKYGGRNFTIAPDHIRLTKKGDFEEAGGEFDPGRQITLIEPPRNDLDFAYITAHELLHFKSHGAMQVPMSKEMQIDMSYRVGLQLSSRDGTQVFFGALEEAVTEMLTKRLMEEKFKTDLKFASIHQVTDQLMQANKTDMEQKGVVKSEVIFLDANGDGRRYGYINERGGVEALIDKLYIRNPTQFKNTEEVFEVFARAKFTGNMLPLGRLIEGSFGSGAFRKIAEARKKTSELRDVVEAL